MGWVGMPTDSSRPLAVLAGLANLSGSTTATAISRTGSSSRPGVPGSFDGTCNSYDCATLEAVEHTRSMKTSRH